MSPKAVLLFCAHVLLVQSALSQCTSCGAVEATDCADSILMDDGIAAPSVSNNYAARSCGLAGPLAYDGYRGPLGYNGFVAPSAYNGRIGSGYSGLDYTPTSGGSLTVTSISAIPPTGISVVSENAFDGNLAIAGEVPFSSTTGMEGVLPSGGSGAVNHACGNGRNSIVSETSAFAPNYAGAFGSGAAIAPTYGAAIAPIGPASGYSGCGRRIIY